MNMKQKQGEHKAKNRRKYILRELILEEFMHLIHMRMNCNL